jgi:ribonuclease HI
MSLNPYALYVHCDGAMDYGPNRFGGVGIVLKFPDFTGLEEMRFSLGKYSNTNIERLELEALIQGIGETRKVFQKYKSELSNVHHVIFLTDRDGLSDTRRTNPSAIRNWRHDNWKNHEGVPIKNPDLLDELDKLRTKLAKEARARINIEYRPRNKNKMADRLSKKAKENGIVDKSLENPSLKLFRRRFDGDQVRYKAFKAEQILHIHVYHKIGLREGWQVWAELCSGADLGKKLQLYVDDATAAFLQRGNEFNVRLEKVNLFNFQIYPDLQKLEKKVEEIDA